MLDDMIAKWSVPRDDAFMIVLERERGEALNEVNNKNDTRDGDECPAYYKYDAAEKMIAYARPSGLVGLAVQMRVLYYTSKNELLCEPDVLALVENVRNGIEALIKNSNTEQVA